MTLSPASASSQREWLTIRETGTTVTRPFLARPHASYGQFVLTNAVLSAEARCSGRTNRNAFQARGDGMLGASMFPTHVES